ncbi:MAG: PIG-L family deacetylase [Actinobacteria bacterium]|nr:PIG-L family deacetylase [Actinomycetota bacterium]
MATLVTFHAHPDDETISCGGTIAEAAANGHRVVLISATRGDHGEVPDGFLQPGEELRDRRTMELEEAARILGIQRVEHLGYEDSGMIGTPENDAPGSFWKADLEEAAGIVAAILHEEAADIFTTYDPLGTYGHPDHIQTHRVGMRAAELAGTKRVYQSAPNRDAIIRNFERLRESGIDMPFDAPPTDLGVPEEEITTAVDVGAHLSVKRRAMAAHPSQISETSFFLAMPDEWFFEAFGTEWFIRIGRARGKPWETSLFEGLD